MSEKSCLECSENRTYECPRGPTLVFLTFISVLLGLKVVTCQNVNVSWVMESSIVMFGGTANLTCSIRGPTTSCEPFQHQWYGGQNHTLLCRSVECRNPTKHSEVEESSCRYTLTIHNFSETDINCEYSCYYGTSYQRRMLVLDEHHFAYIPNMDDIYAEQSIATSKQVMLIIGMRKVFPLPSCTTTSQGENITKHIDLIIKRNGIFYSLIFNISYTSSECFSQLKMQCKISNIFLTPFDHKLSTCREEIQNSKYTKIIGMSFGAAGVVVLLIVTLVYVFCRKPKKQNKRTDESKFIPLADQDKE